MVSEVNFFFASCLAFSSQKKEKKEKAITHQIF
jgi:hypothetical protein